MTTTTTTTRGPAPADARAHQLLAAAARAMRVPVAALTDPSREAGTVRRRHLAAAAMLRAGASGSAVARALGQDHATIFHARRKVARDPALSAQAAALAQAIAPASPAAALDRLIREARTAAALLEAAGHVDRAAALRRAAEGAGHGC